MIEAYLYIGTKRKSPTDKGYWDLRMFRSHEEACEFLAERKSKILEEIRYEGGVPDICRDTPDNFFCVDLDGERTEMKLMEFRLLHEAEETYEAYVVCEFAVDSDGGILSRTKVFGDYIDASSYIFNKAKWVRDSWGFEDEPYIGSYSHYIEFGDSEGDRKFCLWYEKFKIQ